MYRALACVEVGNSLSLTFDSFTSASPVLCHHADNVNLTEARGFGAGQRVLQPEPPMK